MLEEIIEFLEKKGYKDGNNLPDSTPGNLYHFRSCKPNMLVPASHLKNTLSCLLKDNGYTIVEMGSILKIKK